MGKISAVQRFEHFVLFNCTEGHLVQYKESSVNVRRDTGSRWEVRTYSAAVVWEYVTNF